MERKLRVYLGFGLMGLLITSLRNKLSSVYVSYTGVSGARGGRSPSYLVQRQTGITWGSESPRLHPPIPICSPSTHEAEVLRPCISGMCGHVQPRRHGLQSEKGPWSWPSFFLSFKKLRKLRPREK